MGADASACVPFPRASAQSGMTVVVVCQVTDLAAEMAELWSRGLVFEEYDAPGMQMENGIARGGGALAAWFKDSEGNTMAIIQSA